MKSTVEFIVPFQKGEYEYIGFNLETGAEQFVFPCQYFNVSKENVSDDILAEREKFRKAEAKKIISLIKRVQKEFLFGGYGNEAFQYYSMNWLLCDYIDNGYYTEKEYVIGKGDRGRIDWKHTLRRSGIYFDGINILYRDFYVQKNKIDQGNLLAQIYKCCLTYAAKCIGFLYNVSQTEGSVFRIDSPSDVAFMSYHVKKELGETFNTYKRVLLQNLFTILQGRQGTLKSVNFCVHDKEFEYVFEFLVNSIFGTENVHEYYNEYKYVINNKMYSAAKLRPDTIMSCSEFKNDGNRDVNNTQADFFVIDAKYYNYGYTNKSNDLPQASAIAKQIGYNYFLKGKTGKKFYSVFLLPFAKERTQDSCFMLDACDLLKCVGYASGGFVQNNIVENNMNKVAVCLVDLKALVDVFFNVAKDKNGKAIGKAEMRKALWEKVSGIFK